MLRGRRALLLSALGAASCGLHPVYAPVSGKGTDAPASQLAAIQVGLIPDRTGQLLRLALQERFERSGAAPARLYDLTVNYAVSSENIGILQDYASTRVRYIGRATYTLTTDVPVHTTLTSGSAQALDGLNQFDQQFFAADQEGETVQRRMAGQLADEIALQLAVYFRKRAAAPGG